MKIHIPGPNYTTQCGHYGLIQQQTIQPYRVTCKKCQHIMSRNRIRPWWRSPAPGQFVSTSKVMAVGPNLMKKHLRKSYV